MNSLLRHDAHCRLCGSTRVVSVLKLADTPLEDQFLKQPRPQQSFPLELALCEECGYVHLPHIVSPEASYEDYLYVSSVTEGLRNHYDHYAREITSQYSIPEGSLVVDLGSNDGSMLSSFKREGMRVLGVEPAKNAARAANDTGLLTICDYFTDEVKERIIQEHGKAALITANYMYANIDDLQAFTRLVAGLLDEDGLFVVQTGYHPEQMKINMFDYIYHEHFSYFSVEVLDRLFSECGLRMIDAVKTSPKGGSLRVAARLEGGDRAISSSVAALIEEERSSGMREAETYRKFGERIQAEKKKLETLLRDIRARGERVVGFGASHSTTTLIHHFELAEHLEYLVDDNRLKHGTYSPGKHLPVFPTSKLYEDAPRHVLLLAWQHRHSIIEKHKTIFDAASSFIVPLPMLQVVPDISVARRR